MNINNDIEINPNQFDSIALCGILNNIRDQHKEHFEKINKNSICVHCSEAKEKHTLYKTYVCNALMNNNCYTFCFKPKMIQTWKTKQ